MLGKQWLNRYLRDAGGSIAERCGDRQRKRNGIEKWPFEMFVESLPNYRRTTDMRVVESFFGVEMRDQA